MSIISINFKQFYGYSEMLINSILPFNKILNERNRKFSFLIFLAFIGLTVVLYVFESNPYITTSIISKDSDMTILGSSQKPLYFMDIIKITFSILVFVFIIYAFLRDIIDAIYVDLSSFSYIDSKNPEIKNLKISVFLLINGYLFRIILFSFYGLVGLIAVNNLTVFKYGISVFSEMKDYGNLSTFFLKVREIFEHPFLSFTYDSAGNFWAIIFKFCYNISRLVISIILPGSIFFILTSFRNKYGKK